MNIEAYLKRINYSGGQNPSLEVLCNLQKAHLLSVPFENLDIHYGIPIELSINKIFEKVVLHARGGFCYELNGLFFELLVSLGFKTKRVSARVYDAGKGYGPEFDHLALIVKIDKTEYLTDVGFGEFAFAPLRLEPGVGQNDPRGEYLIDRYEENYFRVNKIRDGVSVPEYIFDHKERDLSEFAGMCYYHQTSPDSHFTQKRLISMPTENGRITISGNERTIKKGSTSDKILLDDDSSFAIELWKHFGVKIVSVV